MRRSDALSLDRRPQSPTFPNRFLSVIVVGARQCGQGQEIQDERRGSGLTSENARRALYASTPLIAGPSTTKDPTMLAEQLETFRQGADKRIPPDKRAIMHRATADLRASGIMDRVIKVGDRLPPFTLKNGSGQAVRSADLLATGPLVLTVFRGSW